MHLQNWSNKTVFTGDNLPIMRGMNSESVDLIYLDPPFNSQANYAAPIGSMAAGAAFKDTWTLSDLDNEWIELMESRHPVLWRVLLAAMTPSDKSYLAYMAVRLLEMRRVLKPTGSIYLHCDPTMNHYLKLVMDAVFGRDRFLNEIVWSYGLGGSSTRYWSRKHDVILFYAASDDYCFDKPTQPATSNRLKGQQKGMTDVWEIPAINNKAKERTGYPTQKPLALLSVVVSASSAPGDVVFDPFCGCATTLVAADDLSRSWIGIDISHKAVDLVKVRLEDRQGLFRDVTHRTDLPQRTDLGPLPAYNSVENRRRLYGDQAGHCAGCQVHFEMRNLEVDHIIARNKGGTDHIDNLQFLCGNCNRVKGDRGMEYLRTKLQLTT